MTDSELYDMLVNGIQPEGVDKVTDEEVEEYIEVLERILNGRERQCACQVNNKVLEKIHEDKKG